MPVTTGRLTGTELESGAEWHDALEQAGPGAAAAQQRQRRDLAEPGFRHLCHGQRDPPLKADVRTEGHAHTGRAQRRALGAPAPCTALEDRYCGSLKS